MRKHARNFASLIAGLFVIYTSTPAYALTTFYSDFGPGDTYYQSGGYSVAGASTPSTYSAWGAQFTASSSGALSQIDLALTSNEIAVTGNFEPSSANVYLYNDASGSPGGHSNRILDRIGVGSIRCDK